MPRVEVGAVVSSSPILKLIAKTPVVKGSQEENALGELAGS